MGPKCNHAGLPLRPDLDSTWRAFGFPWTEDFGASFPKLGLSRNPVQLHSGRSRLFLPETGFGCLMEKWLEGASVQKELFSETGSFSAFLKTQPNWLGWIHKKISKLVIFASYLSCWFLFIQLQHSSLFAQTVELLLGKLELSITETKSCRG